MIYSFDTSIFVEIVRYYEPSENNKLYNLLKQEILAKRILVTEEVKYELKRKQKLDGFNILEELKIESEPTDSNMQKKVKEIGRRFPNYLDISSTKNQADIFVIALALVKDGFVVSNEKAKIQVLKNVTASDVKHGTKIPTLCYLLEIKHLTLTQFVASFLP